MMAESVIPGEAPVSLDEVRSWLRLGTTIDDAVVAGLVRAATSICEAFIGQWLIRRAGEEVLPRDERGLRLSARPVLAVDGVALIGADGAAVPLGTDAWRARISRDGTAHLFVPDWGSADRARIGYRAGLADGVNAVPEAIRQGIVRLVQHLHDARDGGGAAPPAAIAALWQPWRRVSLGGAR